MMPRRECGFEASIDQLKSMRAQQFARRMEDTVGQVLSFESDARDTHMFEGKLAEDDRIIAFSVNEEQCEGCE